jgi:hypothetical protein
MSDRNENNKLKLVQLQKDVLAGIKQLDQGKLKKLDDSAAKRIKARGRRMLRSK